jgi:glycosyltransferase involved in cell wall biosynthesis
LTAPGGDQRPIKVMHVIANLEVGGAQEVVRSLLPELRKAGCEPIVATFRDGALRADLDEASIPVHLLAPRRHSMMGDPRSLIELGRIRARLLDLARREQVDLVQGHLLRSLDFILLSLRIRWRRLRVVWTFHNAQINLRADQVPGGRFLGLKRQGYRAAYRLTGRWVCAFVAVSSDVAAAIERGIRPKRAHVVTIPNGVSLERYRGRARRSEVRARVGVPEDAVLAICVAKLQRQKGHRYLVDALTSLAPRRPELHLLVVGDGPLADEIARLAEASGLAGRIHLAGQRRDVPELLRASDLFVLPSLWEGLPMALLEAMASGLPVVATNVSGTREVIRGPQDGGVLVEPGSPAPLGEAIDRVVSDPRLRQSLGRAARRRVGGHYSVQAQARAHVALYRACLARELEAT